MTANQQDWRAKLQELAGTMKKEAPLESLVDKIFNAIVEQIPRIETLVGHRWPDDDVWFSFWLAKRFLPEAKDARMVFVNAGEALPGSEGDPSVIHFDTGGGKYDQHGRELKKTASAELFARALGIRENPGLQTLLDMVIKTDNAEEVARDSIHFAIEGYPYRFKLPSGQPDWTKVQERVFELFDMVCHQEELTAKNRVDLEKFAQWVILPNGIKLAVILWQPSLREAAYEKGAAVVLWTSSLRRNKQTGQILTHGEFNHEKRTATQEGRWNNNEWGQVFYTGIQTSREWPHLFLTRAAYDLRFMEAWKRGTPVEEQELSQVGQVPGMPQWFLHDSRHLILNGSRTHTPMEGEFTELTPTEIIGSVKKSLSRIPRQLVSRWKTGATNEA